METAEPFPMNDEQNVCIFRMRVGAHSFRELKDIHPDVSMISYDIS